VGADCLAVRSSPLLLRWGEFAAFRTLYDSLSKHNSAQPVVHLDAGYDDPPCRQVLGDCGMVGQIAILGRRQRSRPVAGGVIERTHA
jgi:hypothetical protein